jgi:allophanate hydrolase
MRSIDSFLIGDLLTGYRSGRFAPADVVESALERADRAAQRNVWIARLSSAQVLQFADRLRDRSIDALPLYGIPFVIKDNIDLAGVATTAGCPAFSYVPARSAAVVRRLIDAGAIPLGKTNLDQFATGLVGTRSPYSACLNSFNPAYISGGSSSGSAVAVATGLTSFALGTDTAGSGRVPAAFNNIVGLKPTVGRLSTQGVIPACRTLDCVSIFALTPRDAARVLSVTEGFDTEDAYSRPIENRGINGSRIGIPGRDQLKFFGDVEYARLFDRAVERVRSLGFAVTQVDLSPFLDAARLLYGGPWAAERYAAIEEFINSHPDALYPVTRTIIEGSRSISAVEAFKAQYHLMELKRKSEAVWSEVDVIMTPTAGTIYEVRQIDEDPLGTNGNLGYYTNFVNLLDLAAVALPGGFRGDGLPFGVTVIGRRSTDRALLGLSSSLHGGLVDTLGALNLPLPQPPEHFDFASEDFTPIVVCGAHMEGLPLNHQLRERGGYLLRKSRTAARYRLYALPDGPPQRPGLVRVSTGGAPIEVEVWAIRTSDFGSLVQGVPSPLGIGKIELEGGEIVSGFLCESFAIANAADITAAGGWRAHLTNL